MRRAHRSAGFTMLETVIAASLIFLLLMMGLPRMLRAYEVSRVQNGEAGLQTLWTAQRLHRIYYGEFAADVNDLIDADLAPSGMAIGSGTWTYQVLLADRDRFRMQALRRTDGGWSGGLILLQDGSLTGGTTHAVGGTVQP